MYWAITYQHLLSDGITTTIIIITVIGCDELLSKWHNCYVCCTSSNCIWWQQSYGWYYCYCYFCWGSWRLLLTETLARVYKLCYLFLNCSQWLWDKMLKGMFMMTDHHHDYFFSEVDVNILLLEIVTSAVMKSYCSTLNRCPGVYRWTISFGYCHDIVCFWILCNSEGKWTSHCNCWFCVFHWMIFFWPECPCYPRTTH